MDPVSLFHPAVAAWFDRSFAAPTAAQAQAWPALQAGRHVLIAAPTGSGKTLAAFLAAIDDLVRQGLAGTLKDETQIVYVSPLKALSNDIQRNLEAPLCRHPRGLAGPGPAGGGNPHLGAHRGYRAGRARPHASPSAAHRGDHAGIALHPARLGIRPRHARDHPHRDRRRDPRAGAEQARHASRAFARAPRRALRPHGCCASASPPRRSRSRRWRVFS